ncbi:MAG: hypothetical protein HYU66_08850, partial [Armatimonadetes bacterium]|nr:hypothetical protein [Armatimonadota bacterium]
MRTALAVALLVAGLLLVTIRGVLGGGPDEEAVFVMTESLARDRDLVFSPAELAELSAHATIWQDAVRPSRDGRYTAVYGPGQALAALPFYLLARLQSPERDVAVRWACGLNPVVTALTAGLLCLWLLQLGFSRGVATAG